MRLLFSSCIVECKSSSSPEASRGQRIAMRDPGISTAWIVAPVERARPAGENIMVGRIEDLLKTL